MSRGTRRLLVGLLCAVATIGGTAATEFAGTLDNVAKLNLSTYPRATRPPEFEGQTIDGQTMSLASQRGKVVLVNFWASWCQECRPEMPMFEQLHREFATKGLSVIGINAREGPQAVRAYAKELRLTFPLVLDPKGDINALYGVIGLPATFIIGRDGRAVARAIGPREWNSAPARNLIRELLAEPAGLEPAR